MDVFSCLGCQQRDTLLAQLQQRIDTLEAEVRALRERLGQNATNSSLPPSANPRAAPPPVVKKPTGRKPGAQPGHVSCPRVRLPAERLTQVLHYHPEVCTRCQTPLPAERGPDDPEPSWHQVAELPPLLAEITEHQGHFRTCPACGTLNHAPIPAAVRAHALGPRLASTLAYLTGARHDSKRGVEEVAETLFGVPVGLGTVTAVEQEMSAALAPAHAAAATAVREAAHKNTDETGWKLRGNLCWLWTAVTAQVAYFLIHARRGAAGLHALLGAALHGVVTTDRWATYNVLGVYHRQLCWAHLLRDFQALVERGGTSQALGEELLCLAEDVFTWWYRVRDGTLSRGTLRSYVDSQRPWLRALLQRGSRCRCRQTAALCRHLLEWEPALWTFTRIEGVEPTNNAAERALRPAVLWRRRSFGCQSEAGCRFVERMLTVVQTLRLQKRAVLDYLVDAVRAHRHGLDAPKILPTG